MGYYTTLYALFIYKSRAWSGLVCSLLNHGSLKKMLGLVHHKVQIPDDWRRLMSKYSWIHYFIYYHAVFYRNNIASFIWPPQIIKKRKCFSHQA